MLHNEARKLLVEGYEATHNAKEIAKLFHVNKYTVYHLEELKRKTGSVELQTWRRGRKALLNSEDKARIVRRISPRLGSHRLYSSRCSISDMYLTLSNESTPELTSLTEINGIPQSVYLGVL